MMAVVIGLMLVMVSLDWGKKCNPVNYKFEHYGYSSEYGYGCKKGCYIATDKDSGALVWENEDDPNQKHNVVKKCAECKDISGDFYETYGGAENYCNAQITCQWKNSKCQAASCPVIVARTLCNAKENYTVNGNPFFRWRNGKCSNRYGIPSDCKEQCDNDSRVGPDGKNSFLDPSNPPNLYPDVEKRRAQCKWECDHPLPEPSTSSACSNSSPLPNRCQQYRLEDKKDKSKKAHRVFGCLFAAVPQEFKQVTSVVLGPHLDRHDRTGYPAFLADGSLSPYQWEYVSRWSIWAFVVTLVLLILFAVSLIGGIAFVVLCGGRSGKEGL